MTRKKILAEIITERQRQDALFGGPDHDDGHSVADWIAILARHVGLAADDGTPRRADPDRFRRQMLRVAAVAVAAAEAHDRRAEEEAMRCWREAARELGEAVLIIPFRDPARYAEGPSLEYAVAESTASVWERENHTGRVEAS